MWFIYLNNENIGPMSADDVHKRLSRGEINLSTHVWRDGMPDWVSLGSTELMSGIKTLAGASRSPDSVFDYYMHVFKCYATFSGRARRSEYWYFVLFNFLAQAILGIVGALSHFPFFSALYSLGVLIPNLSVSVRRMHDTDRSGWFLLIPFYNFYLLCTAGTAGTNRFGEDPIATGLT